MNKAESDSGELDSAVVLEMLNNEIKAANGNLSPRDRLIVLGLTSIITMMTPLQRKVNKLEDYSIALWVKRHPRASTLMVSALVLAVMFFHELSPWVISRLAIIAGLP